MNILILGATGMIGSRIVDEAVRREHQVVAASRSGSTPACNHITPLVLDINDTEALRQAAAKADLVVSAVSPRNSGDPSAEAVASTQSLIDAVGGKRLILVGGAGSLYLPDGRPVLEVVPEEYKAEAEAMLKAYQLLEASEIDYTVLAPALMIAPGERTGNVRLGDRTVVFDDNGESNISAEDFASVLLDEAEAPRHQRTIFTAAT